MRRAGDLDLEAELLEHRTAATRELSSSLERALHRNQAAEDGEHDALRLAVARDLLDDTLAVLDRLGDGRRAEHHGGGVPRCRAGLLSGVASEAGVLERALLRLRRQAEVTCSPV